ncbi:hypothetical protein CISIN_1g0474562mg, partial [Citrus sinensis]
KDCNTTLAQLNI